MADGALPALPPVRELAVGTATQRAGFGDAGAVVMVAAVLVEARALPEATV